jgi:hypothetical protein
MDPAVLGRFSELGARIGAIWERLPGGPREIVRRRGPALASVGINVALALALTAFASSRAPPTPPRDIKLTVVSVAPPKPSAPADMTPPPPPEQQKPALKPQSDLPSAPGAAPAELPTEPAKKTDDNGAEILPLDYGTLRTDSLPVPAGLKPLLGRNPCDEADARKRDPRCKSLWRENTENEVSLAQADAFRAKRAEDMFYDFRTNNCQSSHLGCSATPDKTLIGTRRVTRNSGMGPGGPTGYDQPELQKPNAYHVDPGFGD